MLVRELIEKLQEMDQDAVVLYLGLEGSDTCVKEVCEIMQFPRNGQPRYNDVFIE